MYQPTPRLRDRAGPLAAVILVHFAIGYALLNLTGTGQALIEQADLAVFDVLDPPPPELPPPPPPPEQQRPVKSTKPEGSPAPAAPPNIVSKATPVVVPEPRIVLPTLTPIVAATVPSTGANASSGAAAVAGPGTGAGGAGTGSGGGGGGNGAGGGGNGLGEARARLMTRELDRRDFPPRLYSQAPRGGTVFMVLRVGPDGVPLSCRVSRSFGDAQLDAETCRLAVARLRFSPGRDEQGRPVADYFGYQQTFF